MAQRCQRRRPLARPGSCCRRGDEIKRIGHETFTETISLLGDGGARFYLDTGIEGVTDYQARRCLWLSKVDADLIGVHSWLICTAHARLVAWETNERDQRVGVFAGRGGWDEPFTLRLREKDFTNTCAIIRALATSAGVGSFIVPGYAPMCVRAWIALAEACEPLPTSGIGRAVMPSDEIDPFDDDWL